MQGLKALDDLPAFPDSHERLDTLTKFVTAQEDKLKNMCSREKNELFRNLKKNQCKFNLFGCLCLFVSVK